MESKDFFNSIYDDFFGIEKTKKENEKLKQELGLNKDFPVIEVNAKEIVKGSSPVITKEDKDIKMQDYFEKIEELYITEESKNTLKNMIQYMRKFEEKIEKQYIPFHFCIYTDNEETAKEVVNVIGDMSLYFSYIRSKDTQEVSLYKIEKADSLETLYNGEKNILVFKDWEGFLTQEQTFKDKFLHQLEAKNKEMHEIITVFVTKNKEMLQQVFAKNEDLQERLFSFEIIGTKPDTQEVYQAIEESLEQTSKLTQEARVALLDYIVATYPTTNLSFPIYRNKVCEKILFHKQDVITPEDIPSYEKEKTMDEIFEELNDLVGLTKVKQVLQDLVSLIELKDKAKGELTIKNTNLHMVFLGNPGTGKTTVARIIAQMLYHLHYIKQNKLIEVSSKDLVAEYVGQTAPKTMAVIEKALGGVLFIDEAYSLASGSGQGNSYNEEAIATLIQAMENHRDDLVVIFAGYTKEMQAFLNSNSGIVSRIGYTLEFDDYTEQELLEIFKRMVEKAGFTITSKALEKALQIIREYKNSKNFGNARFARNLYEKTIVKHASNTKGKKSKKLLKTIEEQDISVENLLK